MVTAMTKSFCVCLRQHHTHARVAFYLTLRQKSQVLNLGGDEQACGRTRTSGRASAAPDTSSRSERTISNIFRYRKRISIGCRTGANGNKAAGLEDSIVSTAIHNQITNDWKRTHPPGFDPHLLAINVDLVDISAVLMRLTAALARCPPRVDFVADVCNFGLRPAVGITQMIFSGVFDKFPSLKVFFAETRLGWVPFWMEHADLWYQRHLGWAQEQLGFVPLARLPSEYVKEHILFTVQYERVAIELRHHIGVDHILFATAFPHIECEWPNTKPIVEEIYANVPANEKYRMWAGNTVDFFKLEQTANIQEPAPVGD